MDVDCYCFDWCGYCFVVVGVVYVVDWLCCWWYVVDIGGCVFVVGELVVGGVGVYFLLCFCYWFVVGFGDGVWFVDFYFYVGGCVNVGSVIGWLGGVGVI